MCVFPCIVLRGVRRNLTCLVSLTIMRRHSHSSKGADVETAVLRREPHAEIFDSGPSGELRILRNDRQSCALPVRFTTLATNVIVIATTSLVIVIKRRHLIHLTPER